MIIEVNKERNGRRSEGWMEDMNTSRNKKKKYEKKEENKIKIKIKIRKGK